MEEAPMHPFIPPTTQLHSILKQAATLAQAHHTRLWLVGGVVRDMLLLLPIEHDIDLVVEGDAIALAHSLAPILNGNLIKSHQPFGTATIAIPHTTNHRQEKNSSLHLDLATARTEHYPHPAALPVVQPATIAEDLARRDFSINAMALDVQPIIHNKEHWFAPTSLLDPFNGKQDLKNRLLRVLHNNSFTDDPTRILRSVRLMSRLGLRIEPHTAALLRVALEQKRLEQTSPDRIRTELCLALKEPRPDEVLHLADTLGITPHIFPALHWSNTIAERCARAAHLINQRVIQTTQPDLLIGLLTYELTQAERKALIARYHLPADTAQLLREIATIRSIVAELSAPELSNSQLDHLLSKYSQRTLDIVACAEPPPIPQHIAHYKTIRTITPLLNGNDLQRLGIAAGPQLGHILQELRAAKLNGLLPTYEDEKAWVQNQFLQT